MTLRRVLNQNGSSMCELVHARPESDVVHDTFVVFDVGVRESRGGLVVVGVVPQDAFDVTATELADASLRAVRGNTVRDVEFVPFARAFEVVPVFVEGVFAALGALDEVVGVDAQFLPLGEEVAEVVLQRTFGGVVVCAWDVVVSHARNIAPVCWVV